VTVVHEIGRLGVATPNVDGLLGLVRLFGKVRGLYPYWWLPVCGAAQQGARLHLFIHARPNSRARKAGTFAALNFDIRASSAVSTEDRP
jgi:hypothetical protein